MQKMQSILGPASHMRRRGQLVKNYLPPQKKLKSNFNVQLLQAKGHGKEKCTAERQKNSEWINGIVPSQPPASRKMNQALLSNINICILIFYRLVHSRSHET